MAKCPKLDPSDWIQPNGFPYDDTPAAEAALRQALQAEVEAIAADAGQRKARKRRAKS